MLARFVFLQKKTNEIFWAFLSRRLHVHADKKNRWIPHKSTQNVIHNVCLTGSNTKFFTLHLSETHAHIHVHPPENKPKYFKFFFLYTAALLNILSNG